MKSDLELLMEVQIADAGLPLPQSEYRFHPIRKWRFDYAWPDIMLAVEVEGGTRGIGRHTNPDGYERDCEKYNEATLMGWKILRFTSRMVKETGTAIITIRRYFDDNKNRSGELLRSEPNAVVPDPVNVRNNTGSRKIPVRSGLGRKRGEEDRRNRGTGKARKQ